MKKKVATVWLGGCSGCHMSFLDMDERLLEIVQLADIVRSRVVDPKELPSVDVALIEGAVASEAHWAELKHFREKAKILIAFGDCAVTGNVTALRNFVPKEDVLKRAYIEAESNVEGHVPQDKEVEKLIDRVRPLHEIVKVDFFIPGCPPSADLIFYVLNEFLNDRVPILAEGKLNYG